MATVDKPLPPTDWKVVDNSKTYLKESALRSFAFDDTLCTLAGKTGQSFIRFWVHENTIVLGTQDTRLPFIREAIEFIEQEGYRAVVRNSGGLAVCLDAGILNLSLVFPGEATFSIDEGYERMVTLVKAIFKEEQIEAGEIAGSYCPGSYDLSIDGKKFAGISQRRIRGGIAVQIYLCVQGSGSARAAFIRSVYNKAVQTSKPAFSYPDIQPEVMASLSELTNVPYSIETIIARAKTAILESGGQLESAVLSPEEELLYETQLERVIDRHNRCLR